MDNLALTRGGNIALASGAVAAGTTAGTIKTTATITYVIDGQFYSKSATDNIAFTGPTAGEGENLVGTFQPHLANQVRLYGLWLDVNGNFFVTQGPAAVPGDLANGIVSLQWPEAPRAYGDSAASSVASGPKYTIVAVARVSESSTGSTFVPNTTALATSGQLTVSFINLATLPGEPLRS